MKLAIYLLCALALILMPQTAISEKPLETKDVEPKSSYSVYEIKEEQQEALPEIQVETQTQSEIKGISKIFELTAYTSDVESTGKRKGHSEYGITFSGRHVQENHTASCPRTIPIDTKLYIPSLGITYVCEDRGGAIKDGKLDIYIADYKKAMEFGRKKGVEVIVLSDPQ
jgi:3D (Asp-Asp-Asp) domain-containing protein